MQKQKQKKPKKRRRAAMNVRGRARRKDVLASVLLSLQIVVVVVCFDLESLPSLPGAPTPSASGRLALAGETASARHPVNGSAGLSASNQTGPQADFLLSLVKSNLSGSRAPFTQRTGGQQRDHMHYKTTYACEGNQLELGCQEGKLIHLVRANYGRFSLSICNELGHSNLSVQCASFRAFLLMETRCNKLSNCSVIVSKELFGDPCEGTSKYLEVQYYCDDVNGNGNSNSHNNQQQPPQQSAAAAQPQASPTGRASANGSNNSQASPQLAPDSATTPSQLGGHKSPPAAAQPALHQQQQPSGAGSALVGGAGEQPNEEDRARQQQVSNAVLPPAGQLCTPQTSARNLYWNYTRAGQLARQGCPEGSTGKATWLCDPERARFAPSWSPDFSQCRSSWLQRLAQQLDQLLEAPVRQQQPQSAELARQQAEQLLRLVLNDLALMARTKELFAEDLKRIELMLGQIVGQLRSLHVMFGLGNERRAQPGGAPASLAPLYEDLFVRVAGLCSSLFDAAQRAAWLEVQPADLRRLLEIRLLGHLKEAGLLLAGALPAGQLEQLPPVRQPNLLASFTVISQRLEPGAELGLAPGRAASPNRFAGDQLDERLDESRLSAPLLRELTAKGVTRFLVLDAKKPDYQLIRQQLEQSQADANSPAPDSNMLAEQQWSSRVFGVFGVVPETGDTLDGQREDQLAELALQWPISVDFKLPPSQQQQPLRQCNSLSDNASQSNRCQTLRSNATSHICRCDRFGFVVLAGAPNQLSSGGLVQWPQLLAGQPDSPYELADAAVQRGTAEGPAYIGAAPSKQAGRLSLWTGVFVVLGLATLLVSLAAFALSRLSGSSRLDKKHGYLSGGPTTGPLATEHGLMGGEPLGAPASMMGLTQPACHGYKAHQQLYAAHLPPIAACHSSSGWRAAWPQWLRPARWLRLSSGAAKGELVQHRVITGAGPIAYKSQYQNGYTTGLHQSAAALAAPSSSTSSYVSSAYYEEIGPGNLTKVNASQLAGPAHTTVVEPFKRPAPADRQQLIQRGQQPAWQPAGPNYSHKQPLHSDLSQLQAPSHSSSSSAESASTHLSSVNGSTPRHYLFASPSAVSAYKSSMSQQQTLGHAHHHHLHQHANFGHQQHGRFLPG